MFELRDILFNVLFDRSANEAYLAADKGRAYIVYFPAGGEVGLDALDATGSLLADWINIDTGEAGPRQRLPRGGKIRLSSPGQGNWIAAILAQ